MGNHTIGGGRTRCRDADRGRTEANRVEKLSRETVWRKAKAHIRPLDFCRMGDLETWDGVLSLLERPSFNDSCGGVD